MKEILRLKNITKYYGEKNVITKALDNVSFIVHEGEFVAIMGASGSGKSTLLNVISTIDTISSGEIYIENQDLSNMNENQLSAFRRDHLGFIFQEYNLLNTLKVSENIVLPLNLKHKNVGETNKKLVDVSISLGVADQLEKFPYELSGGQRQRVACARAIINEPSIILADEPTGALDSKNSQYLMKTFTLMNQDLKATILMVTHDLNVGSYANRVLFLKDGKIWNEIWRGDRDRTEFYQELLSCMSVLGGENNAC